MLASSALGYMTSTASTEERLKLHELLTPEWQKCLGSVIAKQPDVERYLGLNRPFTLPQREFTFRALNALPPESWRVVIFGQDPLPRDKSASGLAFCDQAIDSWNMAISPTFRNIMKNLLIYKGLMLPEDKVDKLQQICMQYNIPSPVNWFLGTRAQGVMWLNIALTFSSIDKGEMQNHTRFWKPIIRAILLELLRGKKQVGEGLVFVLWGGYAKSYKKTIIKLNQAIGLPIEFVEANHTAVEHFHTINSFALIDAAQRALGQVPIDWLKAGLLPMEHDVDLATSTAQDAHAHDANAAAAAEAFMQAHSMLGAVTVPVAVKRKRDEDGSMGFDIAKHVATS